MFRGGVRRFSEGVLVTLRREGAVPAIWPLEIANAVLAAERRRRLPPDRAAAFHDLLLPLPVTVVEVPLSHALGAVLDLARLYRLSAYDASYLELAMRLGLPLATLDRGLRQAAGQAAVPLLAPA